MLTNTYHADVKLIRTLHAATEKIWFQQAMRTCAVCNVPHVEWLSPLILATLLATTLVKALVTTDDFYSLEKLVFISPLQVVVPSLVRGFPSQEVGTRYAY